MYNNNKHVPRRLTVSEYVLSRIPIYIIIL